MDITEDIQALTTFRNNSAAFLQCLKKTKRPMVLTVNGKAAAVVQDAAPISGCSISRHRPVRWKVSGRVAMMLKADACMMHARH